MKLLLVEDEAELGRVTSDLLKNHGFTVDLAPDLAWAKEAVQQTEYDLIILDRRLPDGDGKTLISFVAGKHIQARFLFLTARSDLADRIDGLEIGGDDYVVKPFEPAELIARIRALLRRPLQSQTQEWTCGDLSMNTNTRNVSVGKNTVLLPKRELAVLECLIKSAGRVISRERIEDQVYGFEMEILSNTLESHVSRLRKTLNDANAGVAIRAVRGVGYILHEISP